MLRQRISVTMIGMMLCVALILVAYNLQYSVPRMGHFQGSDEARYIFIDIGANNADTLEVFLKNEGAKFDYDFPRPEWATYDQAEIHLFEANPHFNVALLRAKERYAKLGVKVEIYPSTVADTKDGTRIFYLDTVNTEKDFWGSSVYASHPDVVSSNTNGTELSAVNLSRWLLMHTLPRDFVVVKMDVEGSEYEIVPHMAEMGVSEVVDYLLVEWHPYIVDQGGLTADEVAFRHARADGAQERLKAEGVKMPYYDSSS